MKAGRCYYHEYCGFASDNLDELRQHLKDSLADHLESLTVKIHEIEQASSKIQDFVSISFRYCSFIKAYLLLLY